MPRWKTRVSPRSVSTRPYLARRPRPVTRAPVSRWRRSGGKGRRRSSRRSSIDAIRRPLQHRGQAADGRLDFGEAQASGAARREGVHIICFLARFQQKWAPVFAAGKRATEIGPLPSRGVVPTPLANGLEALPMDKVSFGHEQVEPAEKTRRVRGVFTSVASRYDLMNDLMSGGQHRLWKHASCAGCGRARARRSSTWPAAPATSPSASPAGAPR